MKKDTFITGLFSGILLSAVLGVGIAYTAPDAMPPLNELPQLVRPPRLKENVSFAGETLPMNIDTRERMEKELLVNSYYHTSTILAIKNAPRFFPMIERILKEEGVPDDFKYLAVAESNLSNGSSGAGAKGLWQFLKGTAGDFGLEVNAEVEERFHYEKSTRAAARFIKHLYQRTGSWVNAAAAYNMGLANLNKALDAQSEKSFFDLNVNDETSRYVFRIVALKEILLKPQAFGFYVDEDQKYAPFKGLKEVTITSPIASLSDLAHQYGLTYRMLKYYNPWLIDAKLTAKDKKYTILVPE
ncbi:MAG TPA: lytic transglycosylase domain-containing protein [Saprospiraceae bacterium]|nr:lytic transglycosylase domain-containing protein [Saprospiraceae bacterium]